MRSGAKWLTAAARLIMHDILAVRNSVMENKPGASFLYIYKDRKSCFNLCVILGTLTNTNRCIEIQVADCFLVLTYVVIN